jgi:putative transposase
MVIMKLEKTAHSAYQLEYHIVWCPKDRSAVLVGSVEVELRHILAQTCGEYGWSIVDLWVMPDHVHLLLGVPPTVALVDVARTLKSISAVHLFATFPALRGRKFWGSGLWSRSTYYGSVGQVSEDTVLKYVTNQ